MTPPQKKLHYGKIKTTAGQVLELAEGLRLLNVAPNTEIEVTMGFDRRMDAKAVTIDGINVGSMACVVGGEVVVTAAATNPSAA